MCHLLGSDQRVALKIFWWGLLLLPDEGIGKERFAFHFISFPFMYYTVLYQKGRKDNSSIRSKRGSVGKNREGKLRDRR
jgi:hypothetical protein